MWGGKGNPRFILVQQQSAPDPKRSHHLKYRTEANFHSKAFSEQELYVQVLSAGHSPYTAQG